MTTKRGRLRVDWVPSDLSFEARSPRYGSVLVLGPLDTTTHIPAIFSFFWAVSWTYRGVGGQDRALCRGAIEVHVSCNNCFPSFARFHWVSGLFWAKKGCFLGTKYAVVGGYLTTWHARPWCV